MRAFWATTYSFDLKLFDQYILPRLAQNKLNAVVFADHDKISSVWDHLDLGDLHLTRRIGKRYILRAIRPQGGGAFHPKTYFAVRSNESTLVVGSGNLTRGGIDYGHEAFAQFSSSNESDLPSMRAWADWMGGLVLAQSDALLTERWIALRELCPWMLGSEAGSQFVTNTERTLMDQLEDRLPGEVSELHVTAPFFDPEAVALARLLELAKPQKLVLYAGKGTKVNGSALAGVLANAREASVRRFEPREFVHAKLIGVIDPTDRGFLLAGSPNLSRAALTLRASAPHGNQEVAVIRQGTSTEIRDVFKGSGLGLVDEQLDWVSEFEFESDEKPSHELLVLASARWADGGHIQLLLADPQRGADLHLGWAGASDLVGLDPQGISVEPLNKREPVPLLVHLVDDDGKQASNAVVVDDPVALQETLTGSEKKKSTGTPELDGSEMSPLIQILLSQNENLIFDPGNTTAAARAQQAVEESMSDEASSEFWEQYFKEELQHDPRLESYQPLTPRSHSVETVDELLRELQALLHAAPGVNRMRLFQVLATGHERDHPGEGKGAPWSMDARQQLRAYNLLSRWSLAVSDPRHAFIDPLAPVVNFEVLLGIIFVAWSFDALDGVRASKLLFTLLDAFIGDADRHGFLGQVDQGAREEALGKLDPAFAEIAAGLVFVELSKRGWQEEIYDHQAMLTRGIEFGVIVPGPLSASAALHVTGVVHDLHEIDDLIATRVDWVDDATWCSRTARDLGLGSIRLRSHSPPKVPWLVEVKGSTQPLEDNRLLLLARRVLDFKNIQAVAIRPGQDSTFVFEPGEVARARVNGNLLVSRFPITASAFREIEDQGGNWSDLLGIETAAGVAA